MMFFRFMKTLFTMLMCFTLGGVAMGQFRKWTNSEGRTADLKLLSVSTESGEPVGEFKLRNGSTIQLKASQLMAEDAKLLTEWQAPEKPTDDPPSVFDDELDGNLVRLDGKRLKRIDSIEKPAKYFLFYYTASWCPPCRAFTPQLVEWYQENKNSNFELVLITCDQDESAMEEYASEKKMPWPQLKFRKVKDFRETHQHGVDGIPSLIVCDLKGTVLGNYRSRLPELATMVKD